MNHPQILIIDDEVQIQKLLQITLESNDFKVIAGVNAKEGLAMTKHYNPDLILLDLGLPDESGFFVLNKLREWYTKPVIILSVQSGEEDIIRALDNGANDYLVKPFRSGELLARIRSCLRGFYNPTNLVNSDSLVIDTNLRIVKKDNLIIKLTATEYDLLALLAKNEGRVLTHQYLLREVWGPGYINQSQYLRVFVAQLRKKIENEPNRPEYIVTESGVGYRFILKENVNK
jgi:two-component system KDP operon response regulator KdpE